MNILIQLLWFAVYVVILVGVVWFINWAIDAVGEALPPKIKLVAKVVVGLIGLIVLLTMIAGKTILPIQ